MRILIDADGCPVVDITVKVAKKYGCVCLILCDTSHRFEKDGAETIVVPKGADSVDFALVNLLEPGDIVVTQDYGLAALCLSRKGYPINQDGMLYSDENIDALLMSRHIAKKVRQSGGRLKGPKKRQPSQDVEFERRLESLVEKNR